MNKKTLHIVLLLAGGKGHRMHCDRPKQFIEIEGMPVIFYTMQAFQQHPEIDRIYVVCNPEWNDFVKATAQKGDIGKFCNVFPAGETSIDSLRNGIIGLKASITDQDPIILTHEAVRPLVSSDVISQNLQTFRTYGNAVTAIRSNEAYMVSPNGIYSEESIPREQLFRAQTPLTFSLNELTDTFLQAEQVKIHHSQSLYTLIAEVFPSKKLYISPGSEQNFKLTLPEDIDTLKALLTYRNQN